MKACVVEIMGGAVLALLVEEEGGAVVVDEVACRLSRTPMFLQDRCYRRFLAPSRVPLFRAQTWVFSNTNNKRAQLSRN